MPLLVIVPVAGHIVDVVVMGHVAARMIVEVACIVPRMAARPPVPPAAMTAVETSAAVIRTMATMAMTDVEVVAGPSDMDPPATGHCRPLIDSDQGNRTCCDQRNYEAFHDNAS